VRKCLDLVFRCLHKNTYRIALIMIQELVFYDGNTDLDLILQLIKRLSV